MTVANSKQFLSNPSAKASVQHALAQATGISDDMVSLDCQPNPAGGDDVACSYTITIPANAPANVPSPETVAATLFGDRPSGLGDALMNNIGTTIVSNLATSMPGLNVIVQEINHPGSNTAVQTPAQAAQQALQAATQTSTVPGTIDIAVSNPQAFASSPAAIQGIQAGMAKTLGVDPSMVAITCAAQASGVNCTYLITIPGNALPNVSQASTVAALLFGNRVTNSNVPFLNSLGSAITASIGSSDPNLNLSNVVDLNHPGQLGSTTPVASKVKGTFDMLVSNPHVFSRSPAANQAMAKAIGKQIGVDPSMVSVVCSGEDTGIGSVQCSYTITVPGDAPANITSPSLIAASLFGNQALGVNLPLMNSLGNAIATAVNAASNDPNVQVVSVQDVNSAIPPAAVVKGLVTLKVVNPQAFSSSQTARLALQHSIAQAAGVDDDMVSVTCIPDTGNNVDCSYTITYPAITPGGISPPSAVEATLNANELLGLNVGLLEQMDLTLAAALTGNLSIAAVLSINNFEFGSTTSAPLPPLPKFTTFSYTQVEGPTGASIILRGNVALVALFVAIAEMVRPGIGRV